MLLGAEKKEKLLSFSSFVLLKACCTSFSFFKNVHLKKIVMCHHVLLFKLTPEVLHCTHLNISNEHVVCLSFSLQCVNSRLRVVTSTAVQECHLTGRK